MTEHEVSSRWETPVMYLALLNWPLGLFFRMGFPSGEVYQTGTKVIATPEVAVNNPFVQEFFLHYALKQDPPPRPERPQGSRRKDSRPLAEWTKRHPQLTLKEVATLVGYDYKYLRHKIRECDP